MSNNESIRDGQRRRGIAQCEIIKEALCSNSDLSITSFSNPPPPPPHSKRLATMERFEVEQVFQLIDVNKDGRISTNDLCEMMRLLGHVISDEEARCMIKEADMNEDGYIDLEEFFDVHTLAMHTLITKETEEDEGIHDAFVFFDENRDGFISKEELHSVLSKLDIMGREIDTKKGLKGGVTLDDCEGMIRDFDLNGDGFVDYEEFKIMMMMRPDKVPNRFI